MYFTLKYILNKFTIILFHLFLNHRDIKLKKEFYYVYSILYPIDNVNLCGLSHNYRI